MDANELLKKIRRIEIKTRGLSQNIFAGEYHSAFKGRGVIFSEVREYEPGDDVRDIDWNVTSRHNKPYVKVYEEEREMTVIIREIINFEPESIGTDIDIALRFLTNAIKKRSTAFLISDFIDDHDFFKSMSISNRKHDLAAIQVYDRRDADMPDVGLVRLRDMETGSDIWVDTSSKSVRANYAKSWYMRQQKLVSATSRSGVDLASITTDEDFVKALLGLFRRRAVVR